LDTSEYHPKPKEEAKEKEPYMLPSLGEEEVKLKQELLVRENI